MFKYIKLFPTHSEYETYINGQDTFLPNVSYCIEHNGVHYKEKSKQSAIYYNVHFLDSDGTTVLETLQIEEGQYITNPYINSQWYIMGDSSQTIVSFPYIINEEIWFIKRISHDDSNLLKAVFNVSSTTSPTNILRSSNISLVSEIYLDGVIQNEIKASYTFNELGNHEVWYKLIDNTKIVGWMFQNFDHLISVTIPNSVNTIEQYAFSMCDNLISCTIGNGVENIGEDAFDECKKLTNVFFTNNSSLKIIEKDAFRECNIESITLPNSVTTIGGASFYDCTALTNITIPSSITNIGNIALGNCSRLSSVTVEATTPPTLGNNVFHNNASGRKIYVPNTSINAYKAASSWKTYTADIEAIP